MDQIITIEGSEDDLCRILLDRGLIPRARLESLVRERRTRVGGGESVPPLGPELVRLGLLPSALSFEALRVQTKALAKCAGCGAFHAIYLYWSGTVPGCATCGRPLRPRPVQPAPPPASLQESIMGGVAGGETMLDLGGQPGRPSAPASPQESIMGGVAGGETMLDLGGTAARPPASRPPPPASPQESIMGGVAGGETMLDLGGQRGRPSAPASPQESIMGGVAGGETMLDLGGASARPPGSRPPAPASPQESLMGGVSGGETMLDMGGAPPPASPQESLMGGTAGGETLLDLGTDSPTKTSETKASPKGPAETVAQIPKSAAETVLDLGTVKPSGRPRAFPESSKFDPTVLMEATPNTRSGTLPSDTPRSRSAGTHRTDPRGLEATPRTQSGGGGGYSPTKSAPKEVQDAAKDPKRVFGKYVLVKELGRGGAGVVYKAWDTTLAQYVALKFIRDQDMSDTSLSSGSQAIEDFQREARMSAKLRHPNIIRIYELGCMSNRYYLSMDYIEGGSLFEVIHGGKERNTDTVYNTQPQKFLAMMRSICEAVHAAHAHNPPVIHRDLKPHNVLVDKSGTPFVVDFGLAKEVEVSTSQNTMTGVVKGTPSYMAPEQAEGRNKDVDARTDVYSLGAILYELLTGRPPFVGGSVREVLNAICTQLPERPNMAILKAQLEKATGTLRPKPVPKPLETICMKALEKSKADRYPTAKDLADDIGRYLNDEDILAQEPGLYRRIRRQVRQHPLISGGVAAAILCAGVIGGSLWYTATRAGTSGVDQIVAIAREHLREKNWPALKSDAENLRKLDPSHPLIAEVETAMLAHEADLERRRQQWTAGIARLREGSLLEALDALRGPFREAGELKEEFDDPLNRALFEVQGTAENEARELIGPGPRDGWLDAKVKASAKACRERIAQLQALEADADFPFKAAAVLAPLKDGLDKLLAYEGIWNLRVNVAPFAKVTLRRGGRVMSEEWTPIGLRGLEVAGEYRVELAWSAPGTPEQKVALDLKGLQHGQQVVLTGDMTKADVRLEK